ncbi:sporulation protein YunB [Bacillus sp. 31A1R]|uniref:Sporulation protein YunB n=1 Tax=Robertmurraya mangrovi TaxID=3098077 RepID=A0ABU5IYE3_9BACI|nr:sporulation protein YunB [Bacillus sp. 31A1R]MDZ5472137.1 sporulation protein YunB [Bacillus sp. 31A1R]
MLKFRGNLPRRGPLPFRYVFLLTFIFFIFSTAAGLWVINEGLKPTLVSYAESQTRKIASLVINKAINKKIANVMDINEIIRKDPETSLTIFDAEKINRVMGETSDLVLSHIKKAESGDLAALESITDIEIETDDSKSGNGIVYYVPMGQATNNALLGNLGPKIPVRFNAIGDIETNVETITKEIGINNIYVEVIIKLKVNVQIIIPFATKVTTYKQDIPVAIGILEGEVPQFYNGSGQGGTPSLELPVNQ